MKVKEDDVKNPPPTDHTPRSKPRYSLNPEDAKRVAFSRVVVLFLEDWRSGRVTAEEACETLLAAALARGIIT